MPTTKNVAEGPALPNHLAALEQRLGPIEYRPVSSLNLYKNNPRKHPEKQLLKLEASMRQFGDIWCLGKNRLLCGSSLEAENWVRLMDGETAAMVFSDMPYNTRVNGHVGVLGKIKHAEFKFASGEMTRP